MDQEVAEARERLRAKFGKGTQIGGKGNLLLFVNVLILLLFRLFQIGTQRRKHKHVQQKVVAEDKKLTSAIKRFGKCHVVAAGSAKAACSRSDSIKPANFLFFTC